jgi:hypothetical protein
LGNQRFSKTGSSCAKKGIIFKILVLHGNVPEHPQHLRDFHPDIKVLCIPPTPTSLLEPTDEGVKCSFKAVYTHRTFSEA